MKLLYEGKVIEDITSEAQINELLSARVCFILQTLTNNHFCTTRLEKVQNELLVAVLAAGRDPKSVTTLQDLIDLSKDVTVLYYYAECVIYTAQLLGANPSLVAYSDDHFESLYNKFPKPVAPTPEDTTAADNQIVSEDLGKKRKAATADVPSKRPVGVKGVSRCANLNNNYIYLLYRAQAQLLGGNGNVCFVEAALNTMNSPRFLVNFNDHYAKVAADTKGIVPNLKDYADVTIVPYPQFKFFGSLLQEYSIPTAKEDKIFRLANNSNYPFVFPAIVQFTPSMVAAYKGKDTGGVTNTTNSNTPPSYSIHVTPLVSAERHDEVLSILMRLDTKGKVGQLFKTQAPWSDEPQRAFLSASIANNQNFGDPPTTLYLPSALTRRMYGATLKNCLDCNLGNSQDYPTSLFLEPNNEFHRLFNCYMEQTFSNLIDPELHGAPNAIITKLVEKINTDKKDITVEYVRTEIEPLISNYHTLNLCTSLHKFTTDYVSLFGENTTATTTIPTEEFVAAFAENFSKMRKDCAKNKMTPQEYYDDNFLRSRDFQTKLERHIRNLVNFRRFFQFYHEKYMKLINKTVRCLVVARVSNLSSKVKLVVTGIIPFALDSSDFDANTVYLN